MAPRKPKQATWRSLLEDVKAEVAPQTWRTFELTRMRGWQAFASAWLTCAGELVTRDIEGTCPPAGLGTVDQQLSWAWEQVHWRLDAVLAVVDSRCTLSTLVIQRFFEVLSGHGLIFPDGTAHPRLMEMLNDSTSGSAKTGERGVSESGSGGDADRGPSPGDSRAA